MSREPWKAGAAGVVASAAWVVGLSIVGKGLGLAKDIVVASRFGTSASMDAFLVAWTLPLVIVSWFRSPIRSGFVPLFTESLEKKGERESWATVGVFLGDLLALSALIAAAGLILAPWIVSIVAPGFDPSTHDLAASLIRIMIVSVVLATLAGFLTDVLHCYGNFALPGLAHPVNNAILIGAAVVLAGLYGIRGLACGIVIGNAAQVLVQWPIIWRHRAHMRLRFDPRDPLFRGVLRLALPLFIGMAGAKLDEVIDRVFASMLQEGSISGLAYAMRLIELPREILVFAFATVLFPFFSRLVAQGKREEFASKLIDSLGIAFFVLLPVSVAMAILGEPFVRLVFQRGAFGEQSVRFTTSALLLYTPTLWALGLTSTMISGFVALKDTKTPVIAGFVRLAAKVGLVFVFIGEFQHAGIALATSLSHVFKLVLFLVLLPDFVKRGRYARMFRGFAGAAAATAAMAAALYGFLSVMERVTSVDTTLSRVGFLAGAGLLAAVVYGGAAYFVARSELLRTLRAIGQGFRTITHAGGGRP